VTRSTGSSVHSDTCRRLLQASLALAGLSLLSGCELVALKVDLIVASGSPASFAAKRVTDTIPIVMGSLNADPVATGLIATLAHPGGNITGITEMAPQLSGKRLQLLKETIPSLSRVAVFWNPLNSAYEPILKDLEAAAQTVGPNYSAWRYESRRTLRARSRLRRGSGPTR
jgi:ABC transporter substrate binding protein